jgi:membrane protein YdbS with pleckstrin-like domain
MIFFVFVTIFFAPAINPLQLLYLLNHSPNSSGYPFAIYMAVVLFATLILILVNNALVKRHINQENELK